MTLKEFLLHKTNVGDLVWIVNGVGHYIGSTIIDCEDAFIHSLNQDLLDHIVVKFYYETRDWTIKPVLVVYVLGEM